MVKTMRKALSLLVVMAMMMTLVPTFSGPVFAATEDYTLYLGENATEFKKNDETGDALANSADFTWDNGTKTLTLDGFSFDTSKQVAMDIHQPITIVLKGMNSIKGADSGAAGGASYGIKSASSLSIVTGAAVGTLEVTAGNAPLNSAYGIYAMDLTISASVSSTAGSAKSMSAGVVANTAVLSAESVVTAEGIGTGQNSRGMQIGATLTSGGILTAIAGNATTYYSYGVQGSPIVITGGKITAQSGTAGENYGAIYSFSKVANAVATGGAMSTDNYPLKYQSNVYCVVDMITYPAKYATMAYVPPTYDVTVNLKLDGAKYTGAPASLGNTIMLEKSGVTKAGVYTNSSNEAIKFTGVQAGEYKIYNGDEDTGVTVTVSDSNVTSALNFYTIKFGSTYAGVATGATIAASYDGKSISSGTAVLSGKKLVVTAAGVGADEYVYEWSDGSISKTLTIDTVTTKANLRCTVTGIALDDYMLEFKKGLDGTWNLFKGGSDVVYTGNAGKWSTAPGILKLNGFNFSTTKGTALILGDDDAIIEVTGSNSLTAKIATTSYTLNSNYKNLTIRGDGNLVVTAGDRPETGGQTIVGVRCEDATLTVEGAVTLTANGGGSEGSNTSIGIQAKNLIIKPTATVNANSGKSTVLSFAVDVSSNITMTGGKLTAISAYSPYGGALRAATEPENVTVSGGTSVGVTDELVWDSGMLRYVVSGSSVYARHVVLEASGTIPPPYNPGGGTSSGGGGTTTIPAEVVDGSNSNTISVNITQSGGDVSLQLSDSKVSDILKNLPEGDSGDANVTFDISGVKNADGAILPIDAVKALGKENVSVTVKLPEADITIEAKELEQLANEAKSGETLRIEAEYISASKLTADQKAQAEGKRVVDVNVYLGERKVDIPVTVSIPYELKDGETADGVRVWYMDDKGNLTEIKGSYDAKTGLFTFYTGHQSYYLIGYDSHLCSAFNDIKGHWGFDAICYMVENLIMNGTSSTTFEPNTDLSRAMMVQILWKLDGKPAAGSANFDDVNAGAWYESAVAWASGKDVVEGYGNGKFGPNDSITREQMAKMLYSYCQYKGISLPSARDSGSFGDANSVSDWASEAVQAMYKAGIINGRDSGVFDPQGTATRAEIAQMMMNFMEATK